MYVYNVTKTEEYYSSDIQNIFNPSIFIFFVNMGKFSSKGLVIIKKDFHLLLFSALGTLIVKQEEYKEFCAWFMCFPQEL